MTKDAIQLLTAPEARARLGISQPTMTNWLAEGRFPGAWRLDPDSPRSRWRIPIEDVEAIQKSDPRRFKPKPKPQAPAVSTPSASRWAWD
jgi:predicted DNA-binding transcriptional regulator AlpA